MKNWFQCLSAKKIDLNVFAVPSSDPKIRSGNNGILVVEFQCLVLDAKETKIADHVGQVTFRKFVSYRIIGSEESAYNTLDGLSYKYPSCLFVVDHGKWKKEPELPVFPPAVRETNDPINWFSEFDLWNPKSGKAKPALPDGLQHYVVEGHDSYIEVLAQSYEFTKIPLAESVFKQR